MDPRIKYTLVGTAAFLFAILVALAVLSGDTLKHPAERLASRLSGKPVAVNGDFDLRLLSLTPSLRVTGLKVGNPEWAGGGDFSDVRSLFAEVRLLSLLAGDLVLTRVTIEQPTLRLFRETSGRGNWMAARTMRPARSEPLDLPAVRRFVLRDGRLILEDHLRKLALQARVSADESASKGAGMPFELKGSGQMNGQPFALAAGGGSLINVDPDRPYPFELAVRAGETRARARGSLDRPFDFGRMTALLEASGPDLADVYYLTGLALPNSPPYELAGQLRRHGARYDLTSLSGKWGDSDLRGGVTVEMSGDRPRLIADLQSTRLDFDDLGATLGGPPSTRAGETASAEQQKIAQTMAADQHLFPDAKLDVTRIRGMDASVSYRADTVNTRKLPLRKVSLKANLEQGVLAVSPVSFQFPQGAISASVRLDATRAEPRTTLDLRLDRLRVEEFLKKTESPPAIAGVVLGRAQLSGRGTSVRAFASSVDGTATVVIPRGEIREAFAELTGINVARGLGLLMRNDQEKADLRCGVADFKARDGLFEANRIVVDTDDVLITGGGRIDLDEERFDLNVKGRPKKLRLVRVRAPIVIDGPLRKPTFGLEGKNAAAQAGVAAAIGSLVAPIAAIIAFVDPGLAKDADCGRLLAQAKAEGVEVRAATAPAGRRR